MFFRVFYRMDIGVFVIFRVTEGTTRLGLFFWPSRWTFGGGPLWLSYVGRSYFYFYFIFIFIFFCNLPVSGSLLCVCVFSVFLLRFFFVFFSFFFSLSLSLVLSVNRFYWLIFFFTVRKREKGSGVCRLREIIYKNPYKNNNNNNIKTQ